jgi:uncharacterized protein
MPNSSQFSAVFKPKRASSSSAAFPLCAAAQSPADDSKILPPDQLKVLADKGNAKAQAQLGAIYIQGEEVAKDFVQARDLFQKAAENGYAPAMHNLGEMYYQGMGMPKDLAKAAEWYAKAADKGLGQSQFDLAEMYARGAGVPKDEKK